MLHEGSHPSGAAAATEASAAGRRARAPRWSPLRFDGRLGRTEFALFVVAWHVVLSFGAGVVVMVPLGLVAAVASGSVVNQIVGVLFAAVLLVYLTGLASFGVRRLHDMGRSGRWLLLGLIPVVGLAVAVPLLLVPGNEGANAFGERETATLVPAAYATAASAPAVAVPSRQEAAALLEDAYEAGRRFAGRQRERS